MKIIGIGGGAASGKTSAAIYIQQHLGEDKVSMLAMDDYYFHPNELQAKLGSFLNWDCPGALDWVTLSADLLKIAKGQPVTTPYDSEQFEIEIDRRSSPGRVVERKDILIIEGLYALYERAIGFGYSQKIFLKASHNVRFLRRKRFIMTDEYISQVHIPMYDSMVAPTARTADLVLDTDNLTATEVGDSILNYMMDRKTLQSGGPTI
jgi:uridine kinase